MRTSTLIFVSLVVVLYLMVTLAAAHRCKGHTNTPKCDGGDKDVGNNRRRKCKKNANPTMWYYNPLTNKCRILEYRGCAGNLNRWCSKKECKRACRR